MIGQAMSGKKLIKIKDKNKIARLILNSRSSSYAMLSATVAYIYEKNGCKLVIPGKEKKVVGAHVFYSFGRSVDGGPFSYHKGECTNDDIASLLTYIGEIYDLTVLTLRPWIKTHKKIWFLVKQKSLEGIVSSYSRIFPRILILDKPFQQYLSEINKKARNRYRFFLKNGGRIEKADPISYIKDIAAINWSSPIRQGRPLPKSYLESKLIVNAAMLWSTHVKMGIASFYIAFLDDKAVGYAFVPHLNGHAYVSRILVHSRYLSKGTANALITEIVRDLISSKKAYLLQYGYWRKSGEGVSSFLEKQGFRWAQEPVIAIARKSRAFYPPIYAQWISVSNVIPRKKPFSITFRALSRIKEKIT